MRRGRQNLLDLVPVRNPAFPWRETGGVVTVDMVHTGLFAAVAQRLFHRPRVSHIRLDEYGSFLWRRMDGKTDVGALGALLDRRFGQGARPLYPRLAAYTRTLLQNRFIRLKKP